MVKKIDEIKPNFVESLTGEEPQEKQTAEVDLEAKPEDLIEEDKTDEVRDEVLDKIFDRKNLSMITDINRTTAVHLTRGEKLADIYNCDILREFCGGLKEHLVSNKRQGRAELVKVVQSPSEGFGEPEVEPTLTDKIWSKR